MIDFDSWWNSAAADSFRAKNDALDGETFRPVWDAAVQSMASHAQLTAAPQAPAAALDAGVVRDAERYRVLRCYELRGAWPEELGKAPAGLLAFSSLTMSELDRALDDMLGHLPRANVRADYQSWMRATTQERIDAAMSAQAGNEGA